MSFETLAFERLGARIDAGLRRLEGDLPRLVREQVEELGPGRAVEQLRECLAEVQRDLCTIRAESLSQAASGSQGATGVGVEEAAKTTPPPPPADGELAAHQGTGSGSADFQPTPTQATFAVEACFGGGGEDQEQQDGLEYGSGAGCDIVSLREEQENRVPNTNAAGKAYVPPAGPECRAGAGAGPGAGGDAAVKTSGGNGSPVPIWTVPPGPVQPPPVRPRSPVPVRTAPPLGARATVPCRVEWGHGHTLSSPSSPWCQERWRERPASPLGLGQSWPAALAAAAAGSSRGSLKNGSSVRWGMPPPDGLTPVSSSCSVPNSPMHQTRPPRTPLMHQHALLAQPPPHPMVGAAHPRLGGVHASASFGFEGAWPMG